MSTTSAGHHVADIINLLEAADSAEWTNGDPDVFNYWERAQSEKGPGADQPARLFVWSPTSTTKDRFSVDGEKYDSTDTTEVQVWSLDAVACREYQQDAAAVLGTYIDDNRVQTDYATVEPNGENDFREQKTTRRTDHYVMSVEVDTRGLADTDKP